MDTTFANDDLVKQIAKLVEGAKNAYATGQRVFARNALNQLFNVLESEASHLNSSEDRSNLLEFERKVGNFCEDQADLEQAVVLFRRSLEFAEKAFPSNHLEVATSLAKLGVVYARQFAYKEALSLFQRSVEIRKMSVPEGDSDILTNLENLAFCYVELGRFKEAVPFGHCSVELRERLYGREGSELATALEKLGTIYQALGDFGHALPLCQRALSIREKNIGGAMNDILARFADPNTPAIWIKGTRTKAAVVIDSQIKLVEVLRDLGDFQNALNLSIQSVAASEQICGNEHPSTISALNAQGTVLLAHEKFSEAAEIFHKILHSEKTTFPESKNDMQGTLLNNLSVALKGMGRGQEALEYALQSLRIAESDLGENHPALTSAIINLAASYRDIGDYSRAFPLHTRSVAMSEAFFGSVHPVTVLAAAHFAIWYIKQGVFPEALFKRGGVLDSFRKYLPSQLAMLSEGEANQIVSRFFFLAHGLHSLCALPLKSESGRADWRGAEGLAMNKAVIEEVAVIRAAMEIDPDSSRRVHRQRLRETQQEIERFPEREQVPADVASKKRELYDELSRVEAKLAESGGLVAQIMIERHMPLSDVAGAVPATAALVDLVQYRRWDYNENGNNWKEQRYAVYLTFPLLEELTNFVTERVDLGEVGPINDVVETICRRMGSGEFRARDLSIALQRLSELIYSPMARHLTNVSHLIICPDGQLSRIPFEMLPLPPFGEKPHYLVEEKMVTYVTSGREIARLAQMPKAGKTSAPIIFGNPDFALDLKDTKQTAPVIPTIQASEKELLIAPTSPNESRSISRSYRGLSFDPLSGAEEEARGVAKLLGTNSILLLGKDAREETLKKVVSPRVLHLATHGFFFTDQEFKRTNGMENPFALASFGNSDTFAARPFRPRNEDDWENPMIRCGIALAGANHASGITNAVAEDGLLTGLEASQLNLQGTELVILSACQTGVGDIKIGEGVMSLRRAFRIAGAETVLASHWPVSDKATKILMTEFIRRWNSGEPRGKAWREAQLSLLNSKEFSNPYFWATFTLTGQWR